MRSYERFEKTCYWWIQGGVQEDGLLFKAPFFMQCSAKEIAKKWASFSTLGTCQPPPPQEYAGSATACGCYIIIRWPISLFITGIMNQYDSEISAPLFPS